MKKLFSIISASICVLVLVFILVISFVKVNINLETDDPYMIYVYNKSSVAMSSEGYKAGTNEYEKVLDGVNKTTSLSIFKRLVNKTKLNSKIEIDLEGKISKYSTDMKQKYIVVEMIYDKQQDVIVYSNGISRVVSYYASLFIVQPDNEFADIIVYYSTTNDSTKKDSYYASCSPLILNGDSEAMEKTIKNL